MLTPEQASLSHYGVRGMRWGVRKSEEVRSAKRESKSLGESRASRSSRILEARKAAMTRLYPILKKETADRISSLSAGKALSQSLIFGSFGAVKYNELRASGKSRVSSGVSGSIHGFSNSYFYLMPSISAGVMNRSLRKSIKNTQNP